MKSGFLPLPGIQPGAAGSASAEVQPGNREFSDGRGQQVQRLIDSKAEELALVRHTVLTQRLVHGGFGAEAVRHLDEEFE